MINKTSRSLFLCLVLLTAFCHLGTIRRDEDPVLKTQTDPIALKQKMEEIKDGVKGAPTPSFKYYEKEDFLSRTPMKSALEDELPKSKPQNDLEMITEVQPEQPDEVFEEQPLESGASDVESSEKLGPKAEEDEWWVEDQT